MSDPLAEARDNLVGYVQWATPGYDQPSMTANITKYLDALLSAHTRHLAQGEGLDFEKAQRVATGHATPDADDAWGAAYEARLDQQHRTVVGALKAQLAQSEARVKELEREKGWQPTNVVSVGDVAPMLHDGQRSYVVLHHGKSPDEHFTAEEMVPKLLNACRYLVNEQAKYAPLVAAVREWQALWKSRAVQGVDDDSFDAYVELQKKLDAAEDALAAFDVEAR